jgi:Ca-activated chloride channel family protein
MKKRGKALLATLLCAAMALTMAACGSKQAGSTAATAPAASYPDMSRSYSRPGSQANTPAMKPGATTADVQASSVLPMDDGAMLIAAAEGMIPDQPDSVFFTEPQNRVQFNTEEYKFFEENRPMNVSMSPLSTFSIDVDTASYSNVRRYLNSGLRPPEDAVRIEELVNYFSYDLPEPDGDVPFSVTTEVARCPWNENNYLAMIAIQGKNVEHRDLPKSNLVFLLDVSGSMDSPMKLPLLKSSFQLLVEQLGENDRVSIVVYAGASGVVLEGARGDEKEKILAALDVLEAGGSTAGAAGIELAYKVAKENFISGGNNRVILATDGDFNVGVSSEGELTRLIEKKRKEGIFLSVLGFGEGNLKDNKMEALADKGNGNYAYIDSLMEAKKVLVNEMGSTLLTIAKDVKIQVEFNPAKVKEYRLVGYDNRILRNEDFDDDTKDAGEIGAGHNVIAFYEIVPYSEGEAAELPQLKYQTTETRQEWMDEWMEVRIRYKKPDSDVSEKIVHTITDRHVAENPSENFVFASAVAEFGLILRDSEYKADSSLRNAKRRAEAALGDDTEGYRRNFLDLVDAASSMELVR